MRLILNFYSLSHISRFKYYPNYTIWFSIQLHNRYNLNYYIHSLHLQSFLLRGCSYIYSTTIKRKFTAIIYFIQFIYLNVYTLLNHCFRFWDIHSCSNSNSVDFCWDHHRFQSFIHCYCYFLNIHYFNVIYVRKFIYLHYTKFSNDNNFSNIFLQPIFRYQLYFQLHNNSGSKWQPVTTTIIYNFSYKSLQYIVNLLLFTI